MSDQTCFPIRSRLKMDRNNCKNVFSQVKISRYVDNLEVTEIDPLIAYIRSSIGAVDLSEEKLGELKKDLTAVLEKEGKIFITKDSGLFEATN